MADATRAGAQTKGEASRHASPPSDVASGARLSSAVPRTTVELQKRLDARAAADAAYQCVAPASTLLGLGPGAAAKARTASSRTPWNVPLARDACKFVFYVLDVAYVSILYFVAGSLASVAINRIMPPLNVTQPLWKTTGEVIAEVVLTGVTVSIIINIISSMPSPFGLGLCGYDHSKLRELFGGVIIAFSIYFFQADLLGEKMRFLRNGIIEPRVLRD